MEYYPPDQTLEPIAYALAQLPVTRFHSVISDSPLLVPYSIGR